MHPSHCRPACLVQITTCNTSIAGKKYDLSMNNLLHNKCNRLQDKTIHKGYFNNRSLIAISDATGNSSFNLTKKKLFSLYQRLLHSLTNESSVFSRLNYPLSCYRLHFVATSSSYHVHTMNADMSDVVCPHVSKLEHFARSSQNSVST